MSNYSVLGDKSFDIFMLATDQAKDLGFPYLGVCFGAVGIIVGVSSSILAWCYFCRDGHYFRRANAQNNGRQDMQMMPMGPAAQGDQAAGNAHIGTYV